MAIEEDGITDDVLKPNRKTLIDRLLMRQPENQTDKVQEKESTDNIYREQAPSHLQDAPQESEGKQYRYRRESLYALFGKRSSIDVGDKIESYKENIPESLTKSRLDKLKNKIAKDEQNATIKTLNENSNKNTVTSVNQNTAAAHNAARAMLEVDAVKTSAKFNHMQAETADNTYRFLRTTASAYMTRSLALKYQGVFQMRDLIRSTMRIGRILEAKLEAIKLNTGATELDKRSVIDIVTDNIKQKTANSITDILGRGTTKPIKSLYNEKVRPRISETVDTLSEKEGFVGKISSNIKDNFGSDLSGVIDDDEDLRGNIHDRTTDDTKVVDLLTQIRDILSGKSPLSGGPDEPPDIPSSPAPSGGGGPSTSGGFRRDSMSDADVEDAIFEDIPSRPKYQKRLSSTDPFRTRLQTQDTDLPPEEQEKRPKPSVESVARKASKTTTAPLALPSPTQRVAEDVSYLSPEQSQATQYLSSREIVPHAEDTDLPVGNALVPRKSSVPALSSDLPPEKKPIVRNDLETVVGERIDKVYDLIDGFFNRRDDKAENKYLDKDKDGFRDNSYRDFISEDTSPKFDPKALSSFMGKDTSKSTSRTYGSFNDDKSYDESGGLLDSIDWRTIGLGAGGAGGLKYLYNKFRGKGPSAPNTDTSKSGSGETGRRSGARQTSRFKRLAKALTSKKALLSYIGTLVGGSYLASGGRAQASEKDVSLDGGNKAMPPTPPTSIPSIDNQNISQKPDDTLTSADQQTSSAQDTTQYIGRQEGDIYPRRVVKNSIVPERSDSNYATNDFAEQIQKKISGKDRNFKDDADTSDDGSLISPLAATAGGSAALAQYASEHKKRAKKASQPKKEPKTGAGKKIFDAKNKYTTKVDEKISSKGKLGHYSKMAGKLGTRFVGPVGAFTDAYYSINYLLEGDVRSAALSGTAFASNLIPAVGTPISYAITAAQIQRQAGIRRDERIIEDKGLLFKARLKLYGAPEVLSTSRGPIRASALLEKKIYQNLTKNNSFLVEEEAYKDIIKHLSFDMDNENEVRYALKWARERVQLIFMTYLHILKYANKNIPGFEKITYANEQEMSMEQAEFIIDELKRQTKDIIKAYEDILPTSHGYNDKYKVKGRGPSALREDIVEENTDVLADLDEHMQNIKKMKPPQEKDMEKKKKEKREDKKDKPYDPQTIDDLRPVEGAIGAGFAGSMDMPSLTDTSSKNSDQIHIEDKDNLPRIKMTSDTNLSDLQDTVARIASPSEKTEEPTSKRPIDTSIPPLKTDGKGRAFHLENPTFYYRKYWPDKDHSNLFKEDWNPIFATRYNLYGIKNKSRDTRRHVDMLEQDMYKALRKNKRLSDEKTLRKHAKAFGVPDNDQDFNLFVEWINRRVQPIFTKYIGLTKYFRNNAPGFENLHYTTEREIPLEKLKTVAVHLEDKTSDIVQKYRHLTPMRTSNKNYTRYKSTRQIPREMKDILGPDVSEDTPGRIEKDIPKSLSSEVSSKNDVSSDDTADTGKSTSPSAKYISSRDISDMDVTDKDNVFPVSPGPTSRTDFETDIPQGNTATPGRKDRPKQKEKKTSLPPLDSEDEESAFHFEDPEKNWNPIFGLRYRLYGIDRKHDKMKRNVNNLERDLYKSLRKGKTLSDPKVYKKHARAFGFNDYGREFQLFYKWARERVQMLFSKYLGLVKYFRENSPGFEDVYYVNEKNVSPTKLKTIAVHFERDTKGLLDAYEDIKFPRHTLNKEQSTRTNPTSFKFDGKEITDDDIINPPDKIKKQAENLPDKDDTTAQTDPSPSMDKSQMPPSPEEKRRRHVEAFIRQAEQGRSGPDTSVSEDDDKKPYEKIYGYVKPETVDLAEKYGYKAESSTERQRPVTITSPKISPQENRTEELGQLSAQYESSQDGSMAIGYDRTGGTSYGKYQLASKPGTFSRFVDWVSKQPAPGPEIAKRLKRAGPFNTGKRSGRAPTEWKRLVQEGLMGDFEAQFIKKTHYDVAIKKLPAKLRTKVRQSKALRDVLWSTSVQHGPGSAKSIFETTYNDAPDTKTWIQNIYDKRRTQFSSSTKSVQNAVNNRFDNEVESALNTYDKTKRDRGYTRVAARSPDTQTSPKSSQSIQRVSMRSDDGETISKDAISNVIPDTGMSPRQKTQAQSVQEQDIVPTVQDKAPTEKTSPRVQKAVYRPEDTSQDEISDRYGDTDLSIPKNVRDVDVAQSPSANESSREIIEALMEQTSISRDGFANIHAALKNIHTSLDNTPEKDDMGHEILGVLKEQLDVQKNIRDVPATNNTVAVQNPAGQQRKRPEYDMSVAKRKPQSI